MPVQFQTLIASILLFGAAACMAQTTDFPTRPIRIIASTPGGASDFVARLVAQGMAQNLGQQVIVDNQGGASGIIAAQLVAKAAADGPIRCCHMAARSGSSRCWSPMWATIRCAISRR